MRIDELLTLRGQFQEGAFTNEEFLWGNFRITITMIFALVSFQSGLMFWASSTGLAMSPALWIIPIGIWVLCGIGYWNSQRNFRNLLECYACLSKVDDELKLDLTRKRRKSFRGDNSILCDRWLKARQKYETTEKFREELSKFLSRKEEPPTAFDFIKMVYLFISFISGVMLFVIIFLL